MSRFLEKKEFTRVIRRTQNPTKQFFFLLESRERKDETNMENMPVRKGGLKASLP